MSAESAPPQAHAYVYGTNLVKVPAWVLASTEFNARPQQLHVRGTRASVPGLFRMLDASADAAAAGQTFAHYMELVFRRPPPHGAAAGRRHRATWRELLAGWGMDSNGAAGAVMKGWVESRFGLAPTFHREPLGRFPSPAWLRYLEDKASSRYHNNDIDRQLDLLFEYAQWFIGRFGMPGRTFVRLWRGVNRFAEQAVVRGSLRDRACVLRLNNLVSFSLSRERAEEFGDWILEAEVPATKLVFFQGLVPGAPLSGEGEALVIGGDYEVKAAYV
ncbi:MAG TPA: NAD(+)--dinitrogen-reductase ADP-D-ribosyltransferase [Burkholderiales bacterium]|nr:NAD(+) ADP-ribosyltransferase [Betaproteobacteria bacterium]HQR53204.1 NAD(+)--dinitrogen-reductase ADP-D-ribosyltransferase [Burkholderiales bacterium]